MSGPNRWPRRRAVAWLVLLTLSMVAPVRAEEDLVEQGRRIYQQGVRPNGEPLRASGAGGIGLTGEQAACMGCHRRSGMGSREGSLVVSPVTGPILYARPVSDRASRPGRVAQNVLPLRQFARDAYDDVKLGQAIEKGVDPNGRALDALMPRYVLDAADARALVAYLRQLSAAPPPGFSDGMLHLATIVTGDADPLRAQLVAETLSKWSRSGALGGMALDLKVWKLAGPAASWDLQLENHYRQQPAYAVLSGAGRAQWQPVRDFCERKRLPCLFPVVDLAPSAPDDFYTLYFTTGVPLEARLMARYLDDMSPRPARIVQIVFDDAGAHAARLLADGVLGTPVETRRWRDDAPGALIEDLKPGDALVGWLDRPHLKRLADAQPAGPGTDRLLFSGQLASASEAELPVTWRRAARWVSVRSDPKRVQGLGVLGLVPWLNHMNLTTDDEALLSEIYAASYFFGDALARMRGHWNREFLLETLENANFLRPAGSAFFSLSLAPGQREAAKAGYLLGFKEPALQLVVPFGPRMTQ